MALRIICRCLPQTLRLQQTYKLSVTSSTMYKCIGDPSLSSCSKPIPCQPTLCRFKHTENSRESPEGLKRNIIATITQNTSSVTVDSLLYHSTALNGILDLMIELGFKESDITDIFLSSPTILNSKADQLEETVRLLRSEGFSVRQITLTLQRNPKIVSSSASVIEVIGVLRDIVGLSDSNLQEVLTSHQELLEVPGSVLESNYNMLMTVFRRSDIKRMLRKNPLVLLQSKEEVEAKVNYVYHRMGLDQNEMVWANILCYDLDYIQSRHQFLFRAGGFEKPDKHGATKQPNPYLKDILGSPDKEFVTKITGLTIEEYEVFKKLLVVEREIKQDVFEDGMRHFDEDDEDEMENRGYQREKLNKERMKKKILD